MIKKIIILLLFFFIFSFGAKAPKHYGNLVVEKESIKIYDGDTFKCNIKGLHPIIGDNISIRINGIDTPEIRTKNKREKELGIKAKIFLINTFYNSDTIVLKNIRRGKYFRIIADVYVDSRNVGDLLIISGLARKYDGGTKNRRW